MTRDDEIQRIIERAIQSAFIDFPDAENGMLWPQNYKEPNECKTVATAILSALKMQATKLRRIQTEAPSGLTDHWPGLNPFGWI
jgi:hypothetical protein